MRKHRHLLGLLSLLLAACMMMTACGKKTSDTVSDNKSGTTTAVKEDGQGTNTDSGETVKEDITFTYFNPKPSAHEPAEDAEVMQYIYEQTGVKLDWDVPVTGVSERLNIMLATGDMPDLILFQDVAIQQQFIDAGYLVELGDLLAEYAPNAYANLEEEVLPRIQDENGDIWYLPSGYRFADSPDMPESRVAVSVRTGYFDENGWDKAPTTLEEYREVLRDIKNTTDMIPLGMALGTNGYLSQTIEVGAGAYGLAMANYIILQEGQMKHFTQVPEMKEYFKFLNELNVEGLVDPESSIMSGDMLSEKCVAGQVWSFIGRFRGINNAVGAYEQSIGSDEISYTLYPTVTEDTAGTYSVYTRNLIPYGVAITTACEDPARVLEFYEYLNTEMGHIVAQGITNWEWDGTEEGQVGYDFVLTDEVYQEGTQFVYPTDWASEMWGADENWWWNRGREMMWEFTYGECNYPGGQYDMLGNLDVGMWWSENYTRIANENGWTGTNYYDMQRAMSADVSSFSGLLLDTESNEYLQSLDMNLTMEKYIPRAIMAESADQFEAEWAAMEAELEKNGIADVMAAYQTLYEARMAKWNQ